MKGKVRLKLIDAPIVLEHAEHGDRGVGLSAVSSNKIRVRQASEGLCLDLA